MCGITGFLTTGHNRDAAEQLIEQMTERLVHRGPDSSGTWLDQAAGIALGHRRLSIIDLSPQGQQPMVSASGRYVIVYNGEIYNYQKVRKELENADLPPAWRGHSDTEVLLAAIEVWGLEKAVKKSVGMFAFALWDRQQRQLSLVRDRLGEKPLYYGRAGKTLLFASELKSLKCHPEFSAEVNPDALKLLLRHNYIPAPYSIYRGIFKLTPGTILTVSAEQPELPHPVPYWNAQAVAEQGQADIYRGSDAEAITELDRVLRQSVAGQMVSDVPLGAFLSGGFDSSLVVALMQAQSQRPIKTFTIGFHESEFDEAIHAKAVAEHLKTDHTELYLQPQDALDIIPRLPLVYDEPFSDSSQIPTFLVAEMAKQHVTVSLSGDGGDELFAGYPRYQLANSLWQKLGHLPPGLRYGIASLIDSVPPVVLDRLGWVTPLAKKYGRSGSPSDKLYKLAEVLRFDNSAALYNRMVSHWKDSECPVLKAGSPLTALTDNHSWSRLPELTQQLMHIDLISYLPDDILVKVDRAAMGVSLETRVPLLDHRVVEFAWRLPFEMKLRNGQGKWLLRQVLYQYLPESLLDRPKMGFGVPLGSWLRGPLRDWAEALLDKSRLEREGFFNPVPIRQKWQEHLSGKRQWHDYLWDVLMFQAWLEENR